MVPVKDNFIKHLVYIIKIWYFYDKFNEYLRNYSDSFWLPGLNKKNNHTGMEHRMDGRETGSSG